MQTPRVVVAGAGSLAQHIAQYLNARGELLGVLLPASTEPVIASALGLPTLTWPDSVRDLQEKKPNYLLSVGFPHRFPAAWLELPTALALNLHLGYVPYNRGAAAWRWPLVDASPAGVSLHVMDEGSDTGPYLFRHRVPTSADDTAVTLRTRLETVALDKFTDAWPRVQELPLREQPPGGSVHTAADARALKLLSPSDLPTINKMRAAMDVEGLSLDLEGSRLRLKVELRLEGAD